MHRPGGTGAFLAVVAVALTLFSGPVSAQSVDGFGTALKSWATKHKVGKAFVVVRHDGKVVYRLGIGGDDPEKPVQLASLSKAITAACTATLIDSGKLAFDTPLSKALAKFFAANGKPADPRVLEVTVGELLTHRSGFPQTGDPITGANLRNYLRANSAKEPPKPVLLANAFKTKLAKEPGTDYTYSNTGYATLGQVIEETAGKPYAAYCRDALFTPLGIAAGLDPEWAVIAAYGGWQLRGEDYLKFYDLLDPNSGRFGASVKAWESDPQGKSITADDSVWYGLGVNIRRLGAGFSLYHWGGWAYDLANAKDGPLKSSFSTFVVRVADGTEWFVHAEPTLSGAAAKFDLDHAMYEAYRTVKKW